MCHKLAWSSFPWPKGNLMRQCSKCSERKTEENFPPKGNICRECKRAYGREWYRRNPEGQKARSRANYAANRQKKIDYQKEYYRNNYDAVRDNIRKRNAAQYTDVLEDVVLWEVYKRDNGVCGICSRAVKWEDTTIDHVKALSQGGTHTYDNVQIAHLVCNTTKYIN
jgi:5-methylcytosine-specific restriction endonuclease McrA